MDTDRTAITWRCLPMGEAALLVEGTPALPLVNRLALALAAALDAHGLSGIVTTVPAVNSLLIRFEPLALPFEQLEAHVQALLATLAPAPQTPARVVAIPVRYGGADGPDLEAVAATLGLTPAAVVALHCAAVYRVMMVGFTPGFPYIGPLPAALHIPRRATPRAAVPAGSVALAAGMTGIYPARLPGGWNLIGRTDRRLFDPAADPPALLAAGDGVQFTPLPDGVTP